MPSKPVKILVVGQTPPPYLGQAMMIGRLVNAAFRHIKIVHVRLAFSEGEGDIGKISLKKIFHLFSTVGEVYRQKLLHRELVLYYPPSGPNFTPILRDLALLLFITPIFKKKIYHFRAAGISEYLRTKPAVFQWICKKVYGLPDIGIQLSSLNPEDAKYFLAKSIFYIPNGMEDEAINYLPVQHKANNDCTFKILFVGILREDKGLTCLIQALQLLIQRGINNFKLVVMGEFNSAEYKTGLMKIIESYGIGNSILFVGVQTGKAKWEYFSQADFLCFPTYFNSESFGNVLLEAMMFQLPVVATEWRGIPDIVTEETGFLVPVKDVGALADKISLLIENPLLRLKMGENARKRFLEKYTLRQHIDDMENMFLSLK